MDIDAAFRRYFFVVPLLMICVVAHFHAAGAMHLLGASFSRQASARAASRHDLADSNAPAERSAAAILTHNPFDSTKRNLLSFPGGSLDARAGEPSIALGPLMAPACEGVGVRIVTESTDRNWSVAMLQGPGEPHARMRRVGDAVSGFTVEYIGFNPKAASPSVWLSKDSLVCQSVLFGAPSPAPAQAARDEASRPNAVPLLDEIASGIQKVSETEFNVDRAVVDRILERPSELMRVRIVPELQDGVALGIRMFGIRPGTLFHTIGLENGDRVEAINGFNLANPEQALAAYARLRNAKNLSVKLNRRGKALSMDFYIK